MEKSKEKFSWRAFISIGLFYSFVIIFVTGIVLYLAPAGRVSNWVNWKLLGLTKANWQAIHTIFSFIFVILSIFHLFTVNWRAFWSYLKSKSKEGLNKKREFYISTVLSVLIFVGIIYSVPPLRYIMDFGEYLTESWETNDTEPPIPHAELLTLNELAEKLDSIPVEKIINRFEANKIKFDSPNQTLAEIGALNSKTPSELYNLIAKQTLSGMAGSGIGRKTLEQFANENGLDINQIIETLKKNNIKATKDQTIKDVAEANDMAAMDIYNLIKIE